MPWPVMQHDMNHPEPTRLSPADAQLLDRLLAGEPLAEVVDEDEPNRAERVSRLLSLLEHWQAEDSEPGLTGRTLVHVMTTAPVSLSPEDGDALDALLELRRQGLSDGPMPTGVRERAAGVQGVLNLLERAADEPVPTGLTERTIQAIHRDRHAQQQRSAMSAMAFATDRQGSIGLRQIATTAALLLLSVSILLPMLNNAKRQAEIAQCNQNLAGLGTDLQQIAFDQKGLTHQPNRDNTGLINPLAKLAQTNLDGSTIPPAQASYFVLLDQRRVNSQHLACPSVSKSDTTALYNGQNPAAGGPFRLFLQARPIFADANPLYRVTPNGLVRDDKIADLTRSNNHAGRGQNVLISDGSVRWMIRPAIQRNNQTSDNIWLYQPANQADQADDVFLTP